MSSTSSIGVKPAVSSLTAPLLASTAELGEVLVTLEAAQAGGVDVRGRERRDLELKGKSARTSVVVLRSHRG